jgi:hypothetical protein
MRPLLAERAVLCRGQYLLARCCDVMNIPGTVLALPGSNPGLCCIV